MANDNEIVAYEAEDLEDSDKLALALLSAENMLRTRLQKSALVYDKTYKTEIADHIAYSFGGFSEDIDEALDTLSDIGAILESSRGYAITGYGKLLVGYLVDGDPVFASMHEKTQKLAKALSGTSDRELVGLTYKLYPDSARESTIKGQVDRMNETLTVNGEPLSKLTPKSFEECIKAGVPMVVGGGK